MFRQTPNGWKRQKRGVLVPAPTPSDSKLKKVTKENEELKARLERLEALMLAREDEAKDGPVSE